MLSWLDRTFPGTVHRFDTSIFTFGGTREAAFGRHLFWFELVRPRLRLHCLGVVLMERTMRWMILWLVLTAIWISYSFLAGSGPKVVLIPPALVLIALVFTWLWKRLVVRIAGEFEPSHFHPPWGRRTLARRPRWRLRRLCGRQRSDPAAAAGCGRGQSVRGAGAAEHATSAFVLGICSRRSADHRRRETGSVCRYAAAKAAAWFHAIAAVDFGREAARPGIAISAAEHHAGALRNRAAVPRPATEQSAAKQSGPGQSAAG